jgi:hypothetical protein
VRGLEEEYESRETNENVDQPLKPRHRAKNEVDYVPVAACEAANTDEPPVEAADNEEPPSDFVQCLHIMMREKYDAYYTARPAARAKYDSFRIERGEADDGVLISN